MIRIVSAPPRLGRTVQCIISINDSETTKYLWEHPHHPFFAAAARNRVAIRPEREARAALRGSSQRRRSRRIPITTPVIEKQNPSVSGTNKTTTLSTGRDERPGKL